MTEYSEREQRPDEELRGRLLDFLADGDVWAFVRVDISNAPDLAMKVEVHDALDAETLKGVLRKAIAAMP